MVGSRSGNQASETFTRTLGERGTPDEPADETYGGRNGDFDVVQQNNGFPYFQLPSKRYELVRPASVP